MARISFPFHWLLVICSGLFSDFSAIPSGFPRIVSSMFFFFKMIPHGNVSSFMGLFLCSPRGVFLLFLFPSFLFFSSLINFFAVVKIFLWIPSWIDSFSSYFFAGEEK